MYYSQYGQDEWLEKNVFKGKTDGFFLEIGAMDGTKLSNCKRFEDIGWKGIAIEANPLQRENLKRSRTCPLIIKALVPNSFTEESIGFNYWSPGSWGEGLSGIVSNYDPRQLQRISNEIALGQLSGLNPIIQVPIVRVHELFDVIEKIDLLSIDTEGGELEILKDIEYDRFPINVIIVENNFDEQRNEEFLNTKGFVKVNHLGVDEIYVNENL